MTIEQSLNSTKSQELNIEGLQVFTAWETVENSRGKGNKDRVIISEVFIKGKKYLLAGVLDGVSGSPNNGGGLAAQMALEEIPMLIESLQQPDDTVRALLDRVINAIHQDISDLGMNPEYMGASTTLSLFAIGREGIQTVIFTAHVHDSELDMYDANGLRQLTSEGQVGLGIKNEKFKLDISRIVLKGATILIAMTDGISKQLKDKLQSIVESHINDNDISEKIKQELLANSPDGKDDKSCVVLYIPTID